MHLLSNLMKRNCVALKRTAEDRQEWQKLLRAGSQSYTYFTADYMNENALLYQLLWGFGETLLSYDDLTVFLKWTAVCHIVSFKSRLL